MANYKAHEVAEQLRENPVVSMLGIVNEDNYIDADALLEAMKSSANRYGSITMEIPLVGRLSFTENDIEHLKNYII